MPGLPRPAAGAVAPAAGLAAVLAVGLAVVLADRPPDPGRAAVTSTNPAEGATPARAPAEVELSFTGPVEPGRSHISVTGSARTAGALRRAAPERLRTVLRMHRGVAAGANHPSGVKADPTGSANMARSTRAGRSRVREMVGVAEGI
jgi:methionine-rich copper-binding protein CopC